MNLALNGPAGDMKPVLTSLGMGKAFTGAADFTGLSPLAGELAFVQQAATLQVGEKGTVGAAAAAVGVYPASAAYNPVTRPVRPPVPHARLRQGDRRAAVPRGGRQPRKQLAHTRRRFVTITVARAAALR